MLIPRRDEMKKKKDNCKWSKENFLFYDMKAKKENTTTHELELENKNDKE